MDKRVAILGGGFDPPHLGHLSVARHAVKSFGFDSVFLMPCLNHRFGKSMQDPVHRIAMCRLAADGDPKIIVSEYEIKKRLTGESYYMIKSLLSEASASEYGFSMAIGMDNALCFDKWFRHEELKKMIPFVVVPRKGIESPTGDQWFHKLPHRVAPPMETDFASSTTIRALLKEGKSTDGMLHPKVAEYIREHGLYR